MINPFYIHIDMPISFFLKICVTIRIVDVYRIYTVYRHSVYTHVYTCTYTQPLQLPGPQGHLQWQTWKPKPCCRWCNNNCNNSSSFFASVQRGLLEKSSVFCFKKGGIADWFLQGRLVCFGSRLACFFLNIKTHFLTSMGCRFVLNPIKKRKTVSIDSETAAVGSPKNVAGRYLGVQVAKMWICCSEIFWKNLPLFGAWWISQWDKESAFFRANEVPR